MAVREIALPWDAQPQEAVAVNQALGIRPAFAWLGSSPSSAGLGAWVRSASGLADSVGQPGRSVTFVGNTTNGFTRGGGVTSAQTRCTFLGVFTWFAGGSNNFPQICGFSGANSSFRIGTNGNPVGNTVGIQLVKGGVVALQDVTISRDVPYAFITSHDQSSGEYYFLVRNLLDGTVSVGTQTNTQASSAGNGTYGVGIARTDYSGSWNGEIYAAVGSFDFMPRALADQLLPNIWQAFEPQRIWVPVPAGGGGGVTGTLATTNASDALAAAGTTTVAGTLARTNANDTLAAGGTTTVTGSLAKANANDSLAASGSPVVAGSLAKTNADDSLVASGDVGGSVSGSLNRQNANDTLAAAGTTAVVGTVAATNAPDTLSAAGSTTVVGTLAKANGNDTLQAAGAAGSVTGSVAVTNRNDTLEAYGTSGSGTVIGKGFEMGGRAAREVSIKPLLRRILDERAARAEEVAAPEVKLATKEKRQRARLLEKVAARVAIADEPNAEQRFQVLMQQWTQLEPAIQPGALGAAVDQYTAFMSRVADQVARIQQQDEEEAVLVLLLSL